MRFTFKNSQIHIELELFKYVSVGQSATEHRKTSKGKKELLRQRGGSHLCAKPLVGGCSICKT